MRNLLTFLLILVCSQVFGNPNRVVKEGESKDPVTLQDADKDATTGLTFKWGTSTDESLMSELNSTDGVTITATKSNSAAKVYINVTWSAYAGSKKKISYGFETTNSKFNWQANSYSASTNGGNITKSISYKTTTDNESGTINATITFDGKKFSFPVHYSSDFGTTVTAPSISVTPATLTLDATSTNKTVTGNFTVTGSNMTAGKTVVVSPTIMADGMTWGTNQNSLSTDDITLTVGSDGTVNKTVYISYTPTTNHSTQYTYFQATYDNSEDYTDEVKVGYSSSAVTTASLSVSPSELTLETEAGGTTHGTFTITGYNLGANQEVSIEPATGNASDIAIEWVAPASKTTGSDGSYSQDIKVNFTPASTATSGATSTAMYTVTAGDKSANVTITGKVVAASPRFTYKCGSTTLTGSSQVPDGAFIKINPVNYPADAVYLYTVYTSPAIASDFPASVTLKTLDGNLGATQPLLYHYGVAVYKDPKANGGRLNGATTLYMNLRAYKYDADTKKYTPYTGYDDVHTLQLNMVDYTGSKAFSKPNAPDIAPVTTEKAKDEANETILTLSESSVVSGEEGSTIYAKYSNSNSYNETQLPSMSGIIRSETGSASVGVFSTLTSKQRRTSAIQVAKRTDSNGNTYDIASLKREAYYKYTEDRNNADLTINPSAIEIKDSEAKDKTYTKVTTETLDDNQYNVHFVSDAIDTYDESTIKNGTTSLKYTYASTNENIATVDADGKITLTGNPGQAKIIISFGNFNITEIGKTTNTGFNATSEEIDINVLNTTKPNAPTIDPESRKYVRDFNSTVSGDAGTIYYMVADGAANVSTYTGSYIKEHATGSFNAGSSASIEISGKTQTVYAVSDDNRTGDDRFSTVVYATYTYINLALPTATPGVRNGTYYYYTSDDKLSDIVLGTSTAGASVYYVVGNSKHDITAEDITPEHLYLNANKPSVTDGQVISAVTYLDGVYTETVTFTYKEQEGGSWRSYSSTSDRVFREGIQAYIITGYNESQNAFTATGIDVGATGESYLPALTGVLLYSNVMTQKQLLSDGIDGNGISVMGTGGRTSTPDLKQNMLIASDKDFKSHMSTYDDEGNINMAFNRWKDCPKYDGGEDYYGFFSFYENNARDNQNNWRHTAYLQLPKGSKECIYFRNKEVESAKIIIFVDEPTAIRTLQETDEKADSPYYTLSGVQVAQPTAPGIYIHNGHKIIIKK